MGIKYGRLHVRMKALFSQKAKKLVISAGIAKEEDMDWDAGLLAGRFEPYAGDF